MNEIQLFDIQGAGIRFGLTEDGTAYAVASDFAKAMGHRDAEKATRLLDPSEVGTQIVGMNLADGRRQQREVSVIFEDGLWELIFRSTLPGAKAIKSRVKAILKEIRQTGRYGTPAIPQSYAEALELAAKQAREIEARDAELAEVRPDADAYRTLAAAEGDYSVREAAYILNRDPNIDTGQGRLFGTLREFGVIGQDNRPYATHAKHATLRIRSYTNPRTQETALADPQVRITVAGLRYLHKRMGGVAPLNLQLEIPSG